MCVREKWPFDYGLFRVLRHDLVAVKLSLESQLGDLVRAIRLNADVEYQYFAIGDGRVADVIDSDIIAAAIFDLSQRDILQFHGEIDCLHFEQGDDDKGQAFDASEMPPKVKFEQIDEHGSMVHGVISWDTSDMGGVIPSLPR